MKVFFYDGRIRDAYDVNYDINMNLNKLSNGDFYFIDGVEGPSCNAKCLNDLEADSCVFTNSLVALNHYYGWDYKENHTDIYLWVDKLNTFKRIDELTDKEIRYAHNVDKMYLAGEFRGISEDTI